MRSFRVKWIPVLWPIVDYGRVPDDSSQPLYSYLRIGPIELRRYSVAAFFLRLSVAYETKDGELIRPRRSVGTEPAEVKAAPQAEQTMDRALTVEV